MIDSLYQELEWTTNENGTLLIQDMSTQHIKNVLNWLWRNRESLKRAAESEMAFGGPTPSGDAASDAFDSAFEELLQESSNDWVRNLPVTKAMAAELEKRGQRQTFWLPALEDIHSEEVFVKSPSGATLTCRFCGTQYDNHPEVGEVPPVGDGCERCSPPIPEEGE